MLFWHFIMSIVVYMIKTLNFSLSVIGGVAQMVERSLSMWEVRGSMPRSSKDFFLSLLLNWIFEITFVLSVEQHTQQHTWNTNHNIYIYLILFFNMTQKKKIKKIELSKSILPVVLELIRKKHTNTKHSQAFYLLVLITFHILKRKKISIGDTRVRTRDLSICSRMLYHWAISPWETHEFSVTYSLCKQNIAQDNKSRFLNKCSF